MSISHDGKNPPEGLLTVRQAAEELAVKEATIRSWLLHRRLAFIRLSSRCVRIPGEEISRLIREGRVGRREVA